MSEARRASVVSAACLLRSVPLFFRTVPRTPLRVLGIVALDTLHVLRRSRWLPRERIDQLAMFLDFAGLANAACDHKELCEAEYRALHHRLETAGLSRTIDAYLARLHAVEDGRPTIGGDRRRFEEVRAYREAVARLSLMTAAAIALTPSSSDDEIPADSDLETLLRILMQCQIIDDVLDHRADQAAGLPSFLTACTSLPEAFTLTAQAARGYAAPPTGPVVIPLRVALRVVTLLTRAVVGVARPRRRNARQRATGRVRSDYGGRQEPRRSGRTERDHPGHRTVL